MIWTHADLYLSEPRCVKCVGSHLTKQCPTKEKSELSHVFSVIGNHPANYKEWTVYKYIQKRTFPTLRNKQDGKKISESYRTHKSNRTSPMLLFLKSKRNKHETATRQTHRQPTYQQQPKLPSSDIEELKVMMKGLMEQMGTMLTFRRLTSTVVEVPHR